MASMSEDSFPNWAALTQKYCIVMLCFLCDLSNKGLCRINQRDVCPLGLFPTGISLAASIPMKSCSSPSHFHGVGVFLKYRTLSPTHLCPFLREEPEEVWHWTVIYEKVSVLVHMGPFEHWSVHTRWWCYAAVMEGLFQESLFGV